MDLEVHSHLHRPGGTGSMAQETVAMKNLEVGDIVHLSEEGMRLHRNSDWFLGEYRVTRVEDKPDGRWVDAKHLTRPMSSWAPQSDFVRIR
jgi:hypothetical protein